MLRANVSVREAVPEDAPALLVLWSGSADAVLGQDALADSRRALSRISIDPDERVLVAEREGEIVGAVQVRRGAFSAVHTEQAVHLSHLHVVAGARRSGVATVLVEAVVEWAEEKGVEHLIALSTSASREVNRFLARLGLGQVAVVRASPVAGVRAKLSTPEVSARTRRTWQHGSPRTQRGHHVGQVVAQRRHQRRRLADG